MALTILFIGGLLFNISIIVLIVRLVTKKPKKPILIMMLIGMFMIIGGFVAFEPEEDIAKEEVKEVVKEEEKIVDIEEVAEEPEQAEVSDEVSHEVKIEGYEMYDSTKDDIEENVKSITRDFDSTSVEEIKVNEDMATDDPNDYIVLVYLSFDAQNSKKTTRDMINMYNNELGAQLADVSEVVELTIFWEVPYYLEDENSAKANLKRNGDNMFFEEEWYAPVLQ